MSSAAADLPDRPKKRTTVLICLIIMALSVVVWWNYYIKIRNDEARGRLPIMGKPATDPGFVDHEGNERRLELLKGKVIVWSYVYTTCPSGCTGVADEMQKLQKEFGANPKFHLLSISLYPEHDRPAMLKPWVETNRFSGDNWWFLTSPGGEAKDGDVIRKWMFDSFRIPVMRKDEAHILKFPADVWDHPLVMVLTDANGDIRKPTNNDTFWYPFHASYDNGWFPRPIREDVKRLLEEAGK